MEEIARLDEVYIVHVGGKPAYYSHYLPACQKLARELHAKTGNVMIKRKSGSTAIQWERSHARGIQKVPWRYYD